MASDTRVSRKAKDEENSSSQVRNAGKTSTSSCPSTPDSSTLRRSERLEKQATLTTPPPSTPTVSRKQERGENQKTPTPPLRRSERAKNQPLSGSLGMMQSDPSLSSLGANKQPKKEKSVRQLTFEAKEVGMSEKQDKQPVRMSKRIMDARAYKAMFDPQNSKINAQGQSEELNESNGVSVGCSSNDEGVGHVKTLRGPNSSANKSVKENDDSGPESSHTDQKCIVVIENDLAEAADSVKGSKHGDYAAEVNGQKEITESTLNEKILLESDQDTTSSKRKRNSTDMDSDVAAIVSGIDKWILVGGICPSDGNIMSKSAETCSKCFKRRRINGDLEWQDICCCSPRFNHGSHGTSLKKGTGETESKVIGGHEERCTTNEQWISQPNPGALTNHNTCVICNTGGKLLCCDGRGCNRSYHLSCLDPPLKDVPVGVWHCLSCVSKKIKSGVYSVSDGVESIWDAKEVQVPEDNGSQRQKQFFVKYKGLAHIHNRWVLESQLLHEAPSLLAKFNKKTQVMKWRHEWTTPRRLLQKRLISSGRDDLKCHYEWLVKWCGLDYDNATWELESAPFLKSCEAESLMANYEKRHQKTKKPLSFSGLDKKDKIEKGPFVHLDILNSLLKNWKKKQHAVVIDNQEEEMMTVISFILSLLPDVPRPFLIITNASALHSWDEKFFQLSPSTEAVIYHGNQDLRKSIRTSEFYEEGGGVMFQVLITSPEIIVEDLSIFKSIAWEAVIIDKCQSSKIYSLFEQIKMLSTEMRLLLVNGQLKDSIIEYMLNLLECPGCLSSSENLENVSQKNNNLKVMLSKYIANSSKLDSCAANDCKIGSSRLVEYWVPVEIQNVQLEQYCSTLLSNSSLLCSPPKNALTESIHDILISNRKCCDHPYIIDPSLQTSLSEEVNRLDYGINASGKLHALDMMLFEIKKRGLRVIIMFQSRGGSGRYNIGDILDDLVRQRHGENSYERIDCNVLPSKKQAAVRNFNNQKEMFVFLLENRACAPSIKLSSVDAVVIFGSEWNLVSDLKNLQRLTLEPHCEEIKVFRLYTSFTLEEKLLILAKKNKTLDSNLQNIKRDTCLKLLMWGATYLFKKYGDILSGNKPASSTTISHSSFEGLRKDFLTRLSQRDEYHDANNSVIVKVQLNQGNYCCDFPLPGELEIQLEDEELPHLFWKKLLEGKKDQWKICSIPAQRNRKRIRSLDNLSETIEVHGEEAVKKHKKGANTSDSHSLQSALEERNLFSGDKEDNVSLHLPNNLSEGPENPMLTNERDNLKDMQVNLYHKLKPEVANLCKIIKLPEHVKCVAESFLEYVMNNHHVSRESETILEALQISLCWTAASLLKHKLDHNESLALAKQHLKFGCRKEEAEYVYSMLRCLKRVFLHSNSPKAASTSQGFSADLLQSNSESVCAMIEDLTSGQEFSDDHVLSQLGLAQKDVVNSIADVKKKFLRKKKKLSQKQLEEIKNLNERYEAERKLLERKKRTEAAVILSLFGNSSIAGAKRALLDSQYDKMFSDLNCRMEMDRQNLEEGHLAAQNKLQEREDHWVDGLKSWAQLELMNKPASRETILNHGNSKLSDVSTKDQTANKAKSVSNGEDPDETPVISSSNDDDGDMLPNLKQSLASGPQDALNVSVSSSKEQNFEEPVALKAAEVVGSSDGGQSLGEPILVEHGVGSTEFLENQAPTYPSLFSETAVGLGEGSGGGRGNKEVSILMPSYSNEVEKDVLGTSRLASVSGERAEDDSNNREGDVASPTTASGLQNAAMQSGNQNVIGQVEAADSHPQDASNHVNGDAQINLECHGTSNDGQPPVQLVDNQVELSLPDVQHAAQSSQQPFEIPVSGSRMHVPDAVPVPIPPPAVNSLLQAIPPVRMPLQLSQDPLQNELDRIIKETNLTITMHEKAKLQLKSDCEKEIEKVIVEIRAKYDAKLQQVESEFLQKKKELDENHHIVYMNKILAEAFRSKCMDVRPSASPGTQQEVSSSFMQHIMQVSAQNLVQRPPSVGRPPQVSSIFPTSNLQVGSEYRPSAPQLLQPPRPPSQRAGLGISYPTCPMPGQVASNNPRTTFLSQLPSPSPPSVSLSSSQSRVHQPEAAGLFPSSASTLSAVALLVDIDNQASRNAIPPGYSPHLIDAASGSNPSAPLQNVTQGNSASPIYLSDDE